MIDFNKIPERLKLLLIYILLLPFWVISIYLFSNDLYKTEDYLIISSVCLALTLVSSILFIIKIHLKEGKDQALEGLIIESVIWQILYLSLVIFIGYIINVFLNKRWFFSTFLIIYFGAAVLYIIYLLLVRFFKNK